MSRIKTPRWVKTVVRIRDRRCKNCGTKGGKSNPLTVHHKKPKSVRPDLADDPRNCVLLCAECHKLIHGREGKW